MKYLAAAGNGVAFLSKFDIAEEYRSGTLAYLPIRDRAMGKNILSLVQRERRSHGLATSMFAEEIVRALRATIE
ncbi:LysR substrate-binding domain-containing protein [Mesorhizobium sp. UC22_110]